MIQQYRKKQICNLADLLGQEYPKMTVESITEIAKKYGNVKTVTKTPLLGGTCCLLYDENNIGHIFYWATLPFCEEFNLAHEVGHSIIHADIDGGERSLKDGFKYDLEADLFAARICNIPRAIPYLYQHPLDGLTNAVVTNVMNTINGKKEIERLKKLGVYDVLEYHNLIGKSDQKSKSRKIGRRIQDIGYMFGATSFGSLVGSQVNPEYGPFIGGAIGMISFLGYKMKKQ